jgi:hypothetical protein
MFVHIDQCEKRGLTVVSFDRSGFVLFSLWFSNKLIQAPSCERHKTAQRTLLLLFATIIVSQGRMKNWWRYLNLAVFFYLTGFSNHCNNATNIDKVPLPKLQTSRRFVASFEKIYDGEPIITVISNIGEDVHCTIPLFQLWWCEKCAAARHYAVILKLVGFGPACAPVRCAHPSFWAHCQPQTGRCAPPSPPIAASYLSPKNT